MKPLSAQKKYTWVLTLLSVFVLSGIFVGCKEQRIEYHKRPSFYAKASLTKLPDRIVLDDGTIIVYVDSAGSSKLKKKTQNKAKPFLIREEMENGDIILRAVLPEHVLANTLTCLRNEEYELLWDQMLSVRTKNAYDREGMGVEEFAAFLAKRRIDLAKGVNRMLLGLPRNDVVSENLGNGVTRMRFHPNLAKLFRFKTVDIVSEGPGLKLLMIK